MRRVPIQEACKGIVLILLALVPGYFSVEGFVTGETRIFTRFNISSSTGAAAIVFATSYGLFALAATLAAMTYFSAVARRRAALSRWATRAMLVAAALLFLGGGIQLFASWPW